MKRFKVFLFNSLLMMSSSLILQIIRLVFNIYISNNIDKESLGVFHLIMTIYIFGITLASSGISIACTRVVSEEMAVCNDFGVRKSSKMCIYISLTVGILANTFFCFFADFITNVCFHNKVSKIIVYLISIALPIISISSSIIGYFLAVRRVYKTVVGQFLEQITKIIAIVILLKIYLPIGTLDGICFALILGDVISELISFIYLLIIYYFDINKYFNKFINKTNNNFLFRIFRIFAPVALTSYFRSGLSSIKQLIIPSSLEKSGLSCNTSLSKYGTISGMAMPIIMFPASFLISFASLLIPEFSRFYVHKDYKKIRKYSDKLIIYIFLLSSLISVILFVFGNKIGILIYKDIEVGFYIRLFSLLVPFIYLDIIIDCILKGLDAQVSVMFINIVDLLVSISVIIIFVPLFGIKGYIISIFISEIFNFTLSFSKLMSLIKG